MANLIRQPQTYNFAGNIADIVLTGDSSVTFSVPLLLEEVYYPDPSGRITIPLRAFFEAHLHAPDLNDIPDTGLSLTPYTYYLDGTETGTFYVLPGGVASTAIDTALFLKSNFLTWQPQTRRVSYHEPQWLRYVALQAATVKVKAYFAAGDPVTVTLKELIELTQYSLDLNYGRIRGLFDQQPTYYDVWVEAAGERLSFVQRYVLREDDADTVDFFVFENSLGGFDTIRFTGDRKEVAEAESLNAVFDGDTGEYGVDYSKAWLKQTGYIPDERTRVWVLEFFSSCRRYHLGADSLNRIFVTKPKLEATSGEAVGYEFTFAYSHQSKYLNIAREELPERLEIIGPGDELFFLTPRLNEFPLLDPTQDILIPGQYPFTEQWGVLSLASLVAMLTTGGGSGGNGTFYHDQLKNLDTPNQHPIKVISGLQAALDKKLGTSVFDTFLTTYNNHVESDVHLTGEQKSILSRFSIVDGNLQIEGNAYATQSLSQYGPAAGEGSGGGGTLYHDLLEHTDWPDLHPIGAVTGLQSALDGKAAAGHLHTWASLTEKPTTLDGFGITDAVSAGTFGDHLTAFNTHLSSGVHLTAAQRAVLAMLSVDGDGNLKAEGNLYASGWLSQAGPATGGSSGGGGTAYHDQLLNLDYPDQHPIAAIAGLQSALDAKAAASHTHAWGAITGKPGWITDDAPALDGYLPLAGGTLTGDLKIEKYEGAFVAGRTTGVSYLNNYASGNSLRAQLGLWDDGRITAWTAASQQYNDIWHSGNDGSGSGLDADLLDGYHISSLSGDFQTTVDATGLSEDYYYPVTIPVGSDERLRISVIVALNSGSTPSWSGHGAGFSCRFIEEVSGNGWGTIAVNRVILDNTFSFATDSPIGQVGQMTTGNQEVIWVRGGGRYYFYTSRPREAVLRTESWSAGIDAVSPIAVSSVTPDLLSIAGGVISAGNLLCQSISIGGHAITWDAVNNAFKIDGNVYTTGAISQLGPAQEGGSSEDPFIERPVPGEFWDGRQVYIRSFQGTIGNERVLATGIWAAHLESGYMRSATNDRIAPGYINSPDPNHLYDYNWNYYTNAGNLYLLVGGAALQNQPYYFTFKYTKL